MLPHTPSQLEIPRARLMRCGFAGLLCLVGVFTGNRAPAQSDAPLRAPRLAIAMGTTNTVAFGAVGGSLFAGAGDADSNRERRGSLAAASAFTALAGAHFAWIVYAGADLSDRRHGTDDRPRLRMARTGTVFSTIDSAAYAAVFSLGAALAANAGGGERFGAAASRGAGVTLLAGSGVILPFQVWSLVVHAKELRRGKQNPGRHQARGVSPIPSGFRF